jgi:aryl-alcohol dehydrogenase-like predicted oxidoreductase
VRYRRFGRTDWLVSEIAFGGWQLGGDWGPVDDDASIRTLHHAFERGINLVDTAQLYGEGHSEEVIGNALKQWSGEKIYVATKVQPTVWPDPSEDTPTMRGRYPAWHLRASTEDALRRLQVERLDLLQLHGWFSSGIHELDWLETLNDLRTEGKIDQIGVSIRDYRPEEGVDLAALGLVGSIQVVFNLFEQRPAESLFPAAEDTCTAVIARVPLDSGSLAGNWTQETYGSWAAGSVPHTLFRGARFGETLQRAQRLKELVSRHYPSLAEAAMRYALSPSAVTAVIPGMHTPEQVDMNVGYSDAEEFPADLAKELAVHGWPRNYYT